MRYIFIGLFSLFFLNSCSIFIEPKELPLLEHDGYAFDVMINNTPVIELNSKEKESIHWKSMKPISGAISVEIKRRYIKAYDIGHINRLEYQLSCENLASKQQIESLKNRILPDGHYVITIKVRGTKGWDKKRIYVEVKADATQNTFL